MSRRVKHLKEKKKTGHVPKAKKRRKKKKNVVSVDSMRLAASVYLLLMKCVLTRELSIASGKEP